MQNDNGIPYALKFHATWNLHNVMEVLTFPLSEIPWKKPLQLEITKLPSYFLQLTFLIPTYYFNESKSLSLTALASRLRGSGREVHHF